MNRLSKSLFEALDREFIEKGKKARYRKRHLNNRESSSKKIIKHQKSTTKKDFYIAANYG